MPVYTTLLVPLDGSRLAEQALTHAVSLAAAFKAKVFLLSVVRPPVSVGRRTDAEMALFHQALEEREEKMRVYLQGLQATLDAQRITSATRIEHGPIVQEIASAAEACAADLVIIASHGRSGLKRTFFGSVAAGVLNRLQTPLLLVRPSDEA
jgi:nucleotide-binding universal stress UspA family protein